MSTSPIASEERPQSLYRAWRNALAITLLGVLMGIGCFVLLANYLLARMDLYHAAIWQEVGFALAAGIILIAIVVWQRAHGSSLRALGWGKPAPLLAILAGVLLGLAFTSSVYVGARRAFPAYGVMEFSWIRVALAPLGLLMAASEEIMMRGFFMTELQRARVASWLQVVASGACSSLYHSIYFHTLGSFLTSYLSSFVLFSVFAALYVLSKRSLTPSIIAHGCMHVFGDPYLLMMALVAMQRFA